MVSHGWYGPARGRYGTKPTRGFSVLELTVAVSFFASSLAVVSSTIAESRGLAGVSISRQALSEQLISFADEIIAQGASGVASGSFVVPSPCDPDVDVGPNATSCVTVRGVDYVVSYSVDVEAGPYAAQDAFDAVVVSASAEALDGRVYTRSVRSKRENSAAAVEGRGVRLAVSGDATDVRRILLVDASDPTTVRGTGLLTDQATETVIWVDSDACTELEPCRAALTPHPTSFGLSPRAAISADSLHAESSDIVATSGGLTSARVDVHTRTRLTVLAPDSAIAGTFCRDLIVRIAGDLFTVGSTTASNCNTANSEGVLFDTYIKNGLTTALPVDVPIEIRQADLLDRPEDPMYVVLKSGEDVTISGGPSGVATPAVAADPFTEFVRGLTYKDTTVAMPLSSDLTNISTSGDVSLSYGTTSFAAFPEAPGNYPGAAGLTSGVLAEHWVIGYSYAGASMHTLYIPPGLNPATKYALYKKGANVNGQGMYLQGDRLWLVSVVSSSVRDSLSYQLPTSSGLYTVGWRMGLAVDDPMEIYVNGELVASRLLKNNVASGSAKPGFYPGLRAADTGANDLTTIDSSGIVVSHLATVTDWAKVDSDVFWEHHVAVTGDRGDTFTRFAMSQSSLASMIAVPLNGSTTNVNSSNTGSVTAPFGTATYGAFPTPPTMYPEAVGLTSGTEINNSIIDAGQGAVAMHTLWVPEDLPATTPYALFQTGSSEAGQGMYLRGRTLYLRSEAYSSVDEISYELPAAGALYTVGWRMGTAAGDPFEIFVNGQSVAYSTLAYIPRNSSGNPGFVARVGTSFPENASLITGSGIVVSHLVVHNLYSNMGAQEFLDYHEALTGDVDEVVDWLIYESFDPGHPERSVDERNFTATFYPLDRSLHNSHPGSSLVGAQALTIATPAPSFSPFPQAPGNYPEAYGLATALNTGVNQFEAMTAMHSLWIPPGLDPNTKYALFTTGNGSNGMWGMFLEGGTLVFYYTNSSTEVLSYELPSPSGLYTIGWRAPRLDGETLDIFVDGRLAASKTLTIPASTSYFGRYTGFSPGSLTAQATFGTVPIDGSGIVVGHLSTQERRGDATDFYFHHAVISGERDPFTEFAYGMARTQYATNTATGKRYYNDRPTRVALPLSNDLMNVVPLAIANPGLQTGATTFAEFPSAPPAYPGASGVTSGFELADGQLSTSNDPFFAMHALYVPGGLDPSVRYALFKNGYGGSTRGQFAYLQGDTIHLAMGRDASSVEQYVSYQLPETDRLYTIGWVAPVASTEPLVLYVDGRLVALAGGPSSLVSTNFTNQRGFYPGAPNVDGTGDPLLDIAGSGIVVSHLVYGYETDTWTNVSLYVADHYFALFRPQGSPAVSASENAGGTQGGDGWQKLRGLTSLALHQELKALDSVTVTAPASVAQGEQFTVSATVTNGGLPVQGAAVAFSAAVVDDITSKVSFDPPSCTTNSSGVCSVTADVARTTPSGRIKILAATDRAGSATVAVTSAAAYVAAKPFTMVEGGTGQLLVSVTDGDGQPVVGQAVTASATNMSFTSAMTDSRGYATLSVSALPGSSQTSAVTVTAGSAVRSVGVTVSAAPTTITHTYQNQPWDRTIDFTVTVLGTLGRRVPGAEVTVSASSDDVLVPLKLVTDRTGTATVRIVPTDGAPASFTVTVESAGASTSILVQR